MCGIAGFSLSNEEEVNSKRLLKFLLLGIEYRGTDATGFAFLDSTGKFQVHKSPTEASGFVRRQLCLPKRAKVAIAHTRFSTQGSPFQNDNNHPIATGSVVGVHNGHISNDDSLFKDIEGVVGGPIRIAEVDSEAAFAALGWLQQDRPKVLETLRGSAALAWMDRADHPFPARTLHLARVSSSPLIVAQTMKGSVIFASCEQAIINAALACNLELHTIRDIEEGNYLTVVDGEVTNVKTFTPPYSRGRFVRRDASGRFVSAYFDADDWDSYYTPAEQRVFGGGNNVVRITDHRASSTMDKTNERLAAELPDVIDAEGTEADPDDVLYQRWLLDNTVAMNAAIEMDFERDREITRRRNEVHAKFKAFRAAPLLNAYYLSDIDLPVAKLSESEYLHDDRYLDREAAIEMWARGLQVEREAQRTTEVCALKGGCRIGDRIRTRVMGKEYEGEVVAMPSIFPGGMYTLRVFVPCEERVKKVEAIYLNRSHFDFAYAYDKQRKSDAVGELPGPSMSTSQQVRV